MSSGRVLLAAAAMAVVGAFIWRADNYQLYVLALVGLTAIVCVGLNVLLGLSGQISLGHVGFYAIGAYVVGILTTKTAIGFWIAFPLAGLIAGIAGVLLAVPALRVRGPYLAMVTIAFGFIVEQGAAELGWLTGGWNGLIGIPPPSLAGRKFAEREIAVLVVLLTVAAFWLYARLEASPWGKAMRAVRDSEVASQSIGLDPTLIRTVAFALSAAAAGLAGGVFAAMSDFISPESFPFFQSILFLLVVMIGGADRVLGPLIGALVVVLLPELLSWLAQYRLLFVGLLLLLVLRLAPDGFVGLIDRFLAKPGRGRAAEAKRDVTAMLAASAGRGTLAVEDLSVSFGGVKAVVGLSFVAEPGRITSLIGPNGAGKSTVLNLACGFYRPDRGSIRHAGREFAGLPSHQVARAGIARTYQTTQLFEQMSVLDNVLVGLRRGHLAAHELLAPDRDPERAALAESLLAFVGYASPLDRRAGALPHVDKRLVEIARALAMAPSVLALDEPAAGLDPGDTRRLAELLRKVAATGIAVLLVEHDMKLVMAVSDRVVVLDAGQKIAEGAPAEVARKPARSHGLSRRAAARRARPPGAAGGRGRQVAGRRAAQRRLRCARRHPRHRSRGRARRAGGGARRQRVRQVHLDAGSVGPQSPRCRRRAAPRPAHRALFAQPHRRRGAGAGAGGPAGVPRAFRHRQHPPRRLRAAGCRHRGHGRNVCLGASRSCSSAATSAPACSRAASSRCWRSPAGSSPGLPC